MQGWSDQWASYARPYVEITVFVVYVANVGPRSFRHKNTQNKKETKDRNAMYEVR